MNYLDIVVLIIVGIFEIYILYDFFQVYFERKEHKYPRLNMVLSGVLAVGMLFLVNVYGNSYVNILGSLIINWCFQTYHFKANLGARLLHFFIFIMVGFGCEFIFGIFLYIPVLFWPGYNVVQLSEIPWHVFTMKLLNYLILAIIKQFFRHSKAALENRIFWHYLCIPASSLGVMMLTYYSGMTGEIETHTKVLTSLLFFIMLVGNFSVFDAFRNYSAELQKNAEQSLTISQQKMDLRYYEQVRTMDIRHRDFIHDVSHYLKIIGKLAKEKQNDNILSILNDLNIELENGVMVPYCSNIVVNSVLTEKKDEAEQLGLHLDIYIEPGTNLSQVADADLITMLSNLLDNAIRAAKDTENPNIKVNVFSDNDNYFHIIKIVNTYRDQIIRIGDGFVSTKQEEGMHGVGLKSVENTAKKYDGYLECFVENNIFTSVLVLSSMFL